MIRTIFIRMLRDGKIGDWVSFEGYGDTGYYLGTKFVRYMLKDTEFDKIIGYGIRDVKERFECFLESSL